MKEARLEIEEFPIEYLIPAFEDALVGRDLEIASLRFGLGSENPKTLGELGSIFKITRERVRQILERGVSRISRNGKRQIANEELNAPCAQLMLLLTAKVRPDEEGYFERILCVCDEESLGFTPPGQLVHLIVSLLFPYRTAKEILTSIKPYSRKFKTAKKSTTRPSTKFRELCENILWTGNCFSPACTAHITGSVREVSSEMSYTGTFFSKKLSREVQYESKLELQFFMQLEASVEVDWYQEQPFAINYETLGRTRQYYPDVLVALTDGRLFVTEIKPPFRMPLKENLLKWEALKRYCAERGWGALMTDGKTTLSTFQERALNDQFATEVIERLQSSSLSWPEYREISKRHEVSPGDLAALILNAGLEWSLTPFKLVAPPNSSRNFSQERHFFSHRELGSAHAPPVTESTA